MKRPSQDVDPTSLDVLFVDGTTRATMDEVLAQAVADGATEAKRMFPDASTFMVFHRFATVKLPDSPAVQEKVLKALRGSAVVESIEPTPLRWLTGGGPSGPGD